MTHQIVLLLAAPRSGSTATEFAFKNTGLFDLVMHEPNAGFYYKHRNPRKVPGMNMDKMEILTYQEFKETVLKAAEKGRVFIKDMVHYFYQDIANDRDFAKQISFVFLIRDPKNTIRSYLSEDQEVTSEEIGFDSMVRFADCLSSWEQPYQIVDYEDIVRNPENTFLNLCRGMGLPYLPGMSQYRVDEQSVKATEKFHAWHVGALESKKIEKKETKYKFELDDPQVQDLLKKQQPFYDSLRARAQTLKFLTRPVDHVAPQAPLLHVWEANQRPDKPVAKALNKSSDMNILT